MRVLEPISRSMVPEAPLSERPKALAGLRIGLLDNLKPGARVLLDTFAGLLAERYPDATIVRVQKEDVGAACPSAGMAELARCRVVVTAIGD
jgi:hypothetical protein